MVVSSSLDPAPPTSPTSSSTAERIFPIRSVLYPSPAKLRKPVLNRQVSNLTDESAGTSTTASDTILPSSVFSVSTSQIQSPGGSTDGKAASRAPGLGSRTVTGTSSGPDTKTFFTQRFEHAVMADGSNFVVTGREGTLTCCEDEPIHAPGAIQAFGVLLAFDELEDGTFKVQQVSENSSFILGIPPAAFFRADCLSKFLLPEESEALVDALEQLDERDEDASNTETGPHNFQLSGFGIPGSGDDGPGSTSCAEWTAYCAIHRPDRTRFPTRAILEFELLEDHLHPLTTQTEVPTTAEEKGGMPSCGIIEPTEQDLLLSTVSLVKPLRALARMKNKKSRAGASQEIDIVGLLSQINEQMAKAEDLETFLKITAGVFKELTEFDRIMIYQFDEAWNGRVVAEQVNWSRTKDLFRGLNFPASDIPAQARELYKINKVRCLYDRDQPTARMCCRTIEEVEIPLDMTHCHLRAMSPIHVKYLANMGVRSSMSISITAFGSLWGLVAQHCYGRFGHRVSFPVRQLCKLLGESISRNIERLSYAKRLHSRKLINTQPTNANPSGYIVAKAEDLLTLFDADFGCLSIGDEAKILGQLDNSQELLAILEYLREKCFTNMQASQDIKADFPDIDYPAGFEVISGMLSVPLSSEGKDFIVFFRRGQLQEMHWAGNPYTNKSTSYGGETFQPLEPRKSFATWSETVVGKCRAWTDEQRETAGVLCLVYGKFIDVWRQKETALAANQLTNLLLANASHEVRTPLNAIVNYLELALEGQVDDEVRENLTRSHAASRTLIHVINDLLDLTRAEKGNDLFLQDPFDLPATINDAVAVHRVEAERRGLTLDVVESPQGTPSTVLGDRGKVKNIVANVVANAVKHTTVGGVLVEWGELVDANIGDALDSKKDSMRIGISIIDTGCGMSDSKLETLFREFEQVSTVGDVAIPDAAKPTVGLGLAVVARIVRTMGGQLRVESKVGQGSKFTFVLPFILPSLTPPEPHLESGTPTPFLRTHSSNRTISAHGMSAPRSHAGSLDKRRNSASSTGSRISLTGSQSGASDIASLISAMSSSHMDRNTSGKGSARHDNHFPNNSARSPNPSLSTRVRSSRSSIAGRSQNGEVELGDNNVPIRAIKIDPLVPGPSAVPRHSSPPLAPGSLKIPDTLPESSTRRTKTRTLSVTVPASSSVPSSPTPTKADSKPVKIRSSKRSSPPISDSPDPFSMIASLGTSSPLHSGSRSPSPPTPSSAGVASPTTAHVSDFKKAGPALTVDGLPRLPSMRVLVVEDEPINRMIIQKRLQKDGHVVILAEHGGDAIRVYQADPEFDVILMDLQMPIVNGFEAADAIRNFESLDTSSLLSRRPSTLLNGRLPIIAVSASLHERQRNSIEEVGIDGWILKPIDFRRLNSIMRGLQSRTSRLGDVYQSGRWERGGWLKPAPPAFLEGKAVNDFRSAEEQVKSPE